MADQNGSGGPEAEDLDVWKEVSRLYHAALARSGDDRRAFLEQASAGDEALRGEVESLLGSDAAASARKRPQVFAASGAKPQPSRVPPEPPSLPNSTNSVPGGSVFDFESVTTVPQAANLPTTARQTTFERMFGSPPGNVTLSWPETFSPSRPL